MAGDSAVTTLPMPHLEAQLQHDINLIRTTLLDMAALDERALNRALQAFLTGDRQLAYSVILRDQDVDAFETELDRLCIEFIVRHQPAAAVLRFVYSASKVVGALERVGDYAESIARQVLLASALPYDVPTDKYAEIANLAIPMLHNAVRAFIENNADLARTTVASEPRVNQVRDAINAELVEFRENGRLPLEALTPMSTVARRFERVSDQATNICEEALYVATGEYQRHRSREGFRVLFVDEANGCLSQMAEAVANHLAAPRFSFASAGMTAGAVDPQTIQFLAGKGIDASHQLSKAFDQIPARDQLHLVVALDEVAQQALPQRPAKTLGIDWYVPDPSKVRAAPAEATVAYRGSVRIAVGAHPRPAPGNPRRPETGTDQMTTRAMNTTSHLGRATRCAATLSLACLIALALACSKGSEPAKTVIQNTGSDTMVNLAQAWAEEYARVEPAVSVEVSGGGSGTGIAALVEGTVDIANCSRTVEPQEVAQAKKNTGKEPHEIKVGYDALAVYVHKDNPLEQITLEQLAAIYGEGGTVTTWSELGVKMPAGADEIIRVSRQSNSGTYAYFREAILGKGRDFKLGSRDMHGSKDVVELVSKTPQAIGYSGMGYTTPGVKMLRVAKKAGEPALAPTVENTLNHTYPIARPLFMYTLGVPAGPAKKYIDWVLSPAGKAIVTKSGYVPLPDSEGGGR